MNAYDVIYSYVDEQGSGSALVLEAGSGSDLESKFKNLRGLK